MGDMTRISLTESLLKIIIMQRNLLHMAYRATKTSTSKNEDIGIKEEKILRKIEITAVTNNSNKLAQKTELKIKSIKMEQETEFKKNEDEEKISLIDQSDRSMKTFRKNNDNMEKSQN